jgi:acyl carrier protein
MDIKDIIRSFMIEEFKESGFHAGIRDDESLIDTNILDSLSILKLISFMDEHFDIMPDEDELRPQTFGTIDDIKSFIERKTAAK